MSTPIPPGITTILEIGHPEPRRHPIRQLMDAGILVCVCIAATTLTACGFSVGTSDAVEQASDIGIGECLRLRETHDDGVVAASKTDCDQSAQLTFYAAATIADAQSCTGSNTSVLTFDKQGEKLCITPNFEIGQCYQIPLAGGELADYRKVDCDETAATSTVVAESVDRADETITCGDETTKWSFTQPASIGYCLREVIA